MTSLDVEVLFKHAKYYIYLRIIYFSHMNIEFKKKIMMGCLRKTFFTLLTDTLNNKVEKNNLNSDGM